MIDHGQGVKLGPLDRQYLEKLRAWRNDYAIWRYCRQNDLISDLHQEVWFERQSQDPTIKMYLIWGKEDQPVGVCGLTSIDWQNRRAEFSLYIGPEHQKKGYARHALRTLLAHGFKTLGLNCIWGETFDGNPALDMFQFVGFQKEGVRRAFYYREGKFVDAHLVSMLASEWLSTGNE